MMYAPKLAALLILEGAGLVASAAALRQNVEQHTTVETLLVGLAGTGLLVIAVGIAAIKDHLRLKEQRLTDRDDANKTMEKLRLDVMDRVDDFHKENTHSINAVAQNVATLTTVLLGAQGKGGLVEKESTGRHNLREDVEAMQYMLHELEIWAAKMGERHDAPYDPTPLPSRLRRRTGDAS